MIFEWNNSRLTRLQMCGERFRRHDIENDPEPSNPRLVRGSVVHAVAKATLRRKVGKDNSALPTLEETRDLAADLFEQAWAREDVRLVDEDEDGQTPAQAKAESKDFAVAISGLHRTALAPRLRPVAVERKIIVKPKDSDLVIHGTLDVVTQPETAGQIKQPTGRMTDCEPEGPSQNVDLSDPARDTIRDLKTSVKAPNREAAERSQQLSMYAMIRAAEVGTLPEALALDFLWRTPARGELRLAEQLTARGPEHIQALVNRLNMAVEGVKRGVFIPADPTAWWCSEKWCGYWQTCPYVARSRRPQS